jgi:hypothetical protein
MTKCVQILVSMAILMVVAVSSYCGEPQSQSDAALFNKLDANGDGSISLKEFLRLRRRNADKLQRETRAPKKAKQNARRQMRKRRRPEPKAINWINPVQNDQVVDVDDDGVIHVVVDSNTTPDPYDCDHEDVEDAELFVFAKIYLSTQSLPTQGSCPPTDATPLEVGIMSGYWEGDVPGAPSSETYPLPKMTLVVWEVIVYYDSAGDIIEECEECLPYASLTLWGHDPIEYSRSRETKR